VAAETAILVLNTIVLDGFDNCGWWCTVMFLAPNQRLVYS